MQTQPPSTIIVLSAFSDLARKAARILRLPFEPYSKTEHTTEAIQASCPALESLGFSSHLTKAPAFRVRASNVVGMLHDTLGARIGLDPHSKLIGTKDSALGARRAVFEEAKPYDNPLRDSVASNQIIALNETHSDGTETQTHFALVSLREGVLQPDFGAHSTRFVVGHEIGHAICGLAGTHFAMAEFLGRNAKAMGLSPELAQFAFQMAEELYADAIGAMSCPGDYLANAAQTDSWRCDPDPSLFFSDPIYLNAPEHRKALSSKIASQPHTPALGSPEILASCLMAARAFVLEIAPPASESLSDAKLEEAIREALFNAAALSASPKRARNASP